MLAGGSDPFYRQILAAPHRPYIRIEVWSGQGEPLSEQIPQHLRGQPEGGLAILSGSVTATLNSRVARNLVLSVPAELYPNEVTDLLAPFGNEIRAFRGVMMADGTSTYVWPVFRGRIQGATVGSDGSCLIQCSDRAQDVVDVGFISPQNSVGGSTVLDQWRQLIIEAVPNAEFGPSDVFNQPVEPLTWEFDRASAADEMARSVGALWYPLAAGEFVFRQYPWSVPGPPVVTLTDAAGGTVNSWARSRNRRDIFNVVTVTGERLTDAPAVFATAPDVTPGSATNIFGNFGVRSALERLQTPSTEAAAQQAADAFLRTYVAPIEQWTLYCVPDGALELGDAARFLVDGRNVIQVVTGITLPLDLSGNMVISSRSQIVGGVT